MSWKYQISSTDRWKYQMSSSNQWKYQVAEQTFPDEDNLNVYVSGRTDLTMSDTVGSNDVDILTPTFRGGSNRERRTAGGQLERVFDGGSYTMYFKLRQLETISSTVQYFKMGNNWNTRRGFALYGVAGGDMTFTSGDGTNSSFTVAVTDVNTNLVNAGWVQVFIEVDKANNRLRFGIYKLSDDSLLGSASDVDISSWVFNDDDNYDILRYFCNEAAIADVKKFSDLKTLAQCQDNSYITDLQFHLPILWDGTDVGANAHHCVTFGTEPGEFNKYYSDACSHLLDYGYSLYRTTNKYLYPLSDERTADIYVPNDSTGTAIARSFTDSYSKAYEKIEDHEGNATEHNGAESKMNVPVSSWDRSSTTIYEDAVRSSIFYDSSNVNRWHVSELDYLLFSGNCKTGYAGTNFFKFAENSFANKNTLKEIFSYSVDKTGSDLDAVLNYTGDYQAMDAAIQLYADASVNANINYKLGGFTGEESFQVYWGDGTKQDLFTMDDTLQTLSKSYSGTDNYHIYIFNSANLYGIKLDQVAANTELAPENADIGEFAKATNLTYLYLYLNDTVWTGSINELSKALETLHVHRDSHTAISGDVTFFSVLIHFEMYSSVSGHFSKTNHPQIEVIWMDGGMTCTVDVTNMNTLEQLESYADDSNAYGCLDNCTNINHICYGTPNSFYGSLTNKANFEYLDHQNGTGVITLDIATVANAWCIRSRNCVNEISGDIAAMTKLEICWFNNDNSSVDRPTTVSNKQELVQFGADFWSFTETEVNQILADMWANRDIGKTRFTTTRNIKIDYLSSAAPTGQGITDKANLQAYRSPNDDPAYDLWTIDTN